ncbi:MAG: HD-GYP domain-containing protein [Candidatus Dormibacteria bacterium]
MSTSPASTPLRADFQGALPSSLVIASLSRALDLAEGEPMGHAIRACWLGMKVGDWLGLGPVDRQDLFYALLLKDAGCSANAYSVTHWFGADDRSTKAHLKVADWGSQWRSVLFAIRQTAPSAPITRRMARLVSLGSKGPGLANELVQVRCTRGAELVRELGWGEPAAEAVLCLDEHWNGAGRPRGLKGEEIPLLSRIVLLSQTAEIFWRLGGRRSVESVLRRRRGTWFDPQLVDAVLTHARSDKLWDRFGSITHPEQVAHLDPHPRKIPSASLEELLEIGQVFAGVVDAKSPWTSTHSTRTALLSRRMAAVMGLDEEEADRIGLAALLHDLGKLAVSNAILDKAGPLDPGEMMEMQNHTEISYQLLAPLWPLGDVAEMAASHHERLDGSGYHRHLRGPDLTYGAQIVAVADVFEALTSDRPYRRGLDNDQAIAHLRKEAGRTLAAEPISAIYEMVESARGRPEGFTLT